MARVLCTLHNASNSINGVAFEPHPKGVVSEEIDQDTADHFLSINGYEPHDEAEDDGSGQKSEQKPESKETPKAAPKATPKATPKASGSKSA